MATKTQTTPETFATVKATIDKLLSTIANCEVELGKELHKIKRDKLWREAGCENFADCIRKEFRSLTVYRVQQLIKLYVFHTKHKLLLADTILPMSIVEELESIDDKANRELAIRKVVHLGDTANYNDVVNIVDQIYGRETDEPQSETEIQAEHEKEQEEAKKYYSSIDNCKQDALNTVHAFKEKWDAINRKLVDKVLIDAVLDEEI
jgi:hypothetical protein